MTSNADLNKTQVFISYAREDLEFARRLYKHLLNFGLKPWLDKESLLPGERWKPAIKNAIQKTATSFPYYLQILLKGEDMFKVN